MRTWVSLILCLTSVPFTFAASSPDQSRVEVAELHPQLVWQRVSPTPQKPDGPVLYQIQLTLGQPNTLPKYDSSGRHFTSSQILDNGSTVAIGGFSVNGSNGIVTFASGQTFPLPAAGGDVSGSLSSLKVVGLQTVGVSSALPTSGQVLRFNGITWAPATLAASSGGTVTSITAGSGLAASPGNPITTTGTLSIGNAAVTNAMLANPALTVSAGAGLAGGGSVALGNTITLSNTGLLSLGVSAPLVSTGGQSPTLSLSTVDIAHGGTGVTSSGLAGNFLRSNGTAWVASPIQAADLPALSGTYVDLSSNQTIGGNKIFTANITFNNLITGSISGNATTATTAASATTANNALALGGNAAASYSTTTQNDARYLQLSGGTLTGGLNGTTGTFSGAINAGGLQLPATAVATSVSGANSGAQSLSASVFNSTSSTAQNQTFFWQAEPAAATNNTAAPSGTLNLLFSGTSNSFAPTETGLSVAPSGVIKFAAGQTFPGTGSGTVTNVSGTAPLTVTNASTTPNISIAAAGITNSLLANPSLTVSAGSGLTGGGSVALGGTTTLSVGTGAVTNAMLANPSVTINTGSGLSGGGALALGGTLSLANTGLLSLGVSAPLASTGGQSPTLSLGTVQIANGGTGITAAPATGGQFLRSAAAGSWSVGAIQAGDLPSLSGTYVDLATNQSIGGNKTFTGSATFNNLIAGSISGNAATATSAATATNALSLGGNLASAFSTTAQSDARYLQLTGGTMTGAINFAGGQNFPNVLSLTGGTLTGPLSGTSANFSSTGNFGGTLTLAGGSLLPATGTATAATGFNSNAADLVASAFNTTAGVNAAQNQTFRWQAEPINNNQTSASGSLNLLFGSGASTPAETGLSIANNGKITFASGQVFPGVLSLNGGVMTGNVAFAPTQSFPGSVTSVTAADGTITIGGTSGAPTVAVGSITAGNISGGQVVKSFNGLFDNVTLAAGSGISLAPSGQTLTITNTGQIAPAWNLLGNSGTGCASSPCVQFLGTTDNDPIELRVDNQRALRIEPAVDGQFDLGFAPNVIGGSAANLVSGAGTAGAVIAGGGNSGHLNTVTGSFGTVGGGDSNTAGQVATVAGGGANTASGQYAAISGGGGNTGSGQFSSIAGGQSNVASGFASTAAGGQSNTASGQGSLAAGQFTTDFDGTTHHNGVFIWGDNSTVTQGTNANLVASLDNQYLARATGGFEFVTGITPTGAPDASKTVSIAPNSGIISFVAGQTFPGTGNGTVTSITGGTGLTGGTITTTGTLALDTGFTDLRYAAFSGNTNYIQNLSGGTQPGASFNISGDGTVGGTLSAQNAALSGNLALPATSSSSVGVITLGGVPFLHDVLANTFVGQNAGNFTMTGTQDSGFGKNALAANTNGSANSAFGDSAMAVNSGGGLDSAFGALAMANNIVGARDSAFGEAALNSNTTGASNSAFGQAALSKNTTNSGNSAFGTFALLNNTADDNSAFGLGAMQANTIGNTNAAFGAFALNKNTSGSENSAFGQQALMDITTANFNSGFGVGALMLSNGSSNSAFGQNALANLTGGNNDIAVGAGAGSAFTAAESNNIDIGNNGVAGESNTIRIGSGQTSSFIAGNLTLPGTLTMGGNIAFAGTQTFPGTGTVTNIATSTGILGGPITNTGTLSLDTAFTDARYVQKAGDTMTGALNLPADGVAVGSTEFTVAGGYVGIGISSPNAHLGIFSNNAGTPPPSTLPDGRLNADSTNAPQLDLYNADAANGAFITLRAASGASTPWAVYRYGSNGSSAIGANPLGGQANRFCVGVLGVSEPLCAISNGNVGISGNMSVAGSISASSFSGNGAQLTNLNPANIGATGIVPIANGGTGITSSGLAGHYLRSDGSAWSSSAIQVGDVPPLSYLSLGGGTVTGAVFFTAPVNFSNFLDLPGGAGFITSSATPGAGQNSSTLELDASAWNTTLVGAQTQQFIWQAEPVGNNSPTPSGTLNLLFAQNNTPAETGLNIASSGQITFAAGQKVPSVASLKFPGRSTAISQTLFTPSSDGVFRISIYAVTMIPDTGGGAVSVMPSLSWTDDGGAKTNSFSPIDLTVRGAPSQATFVLEGKASDAVNFSTTITGSVTNGQYSFYITAEQIM